MFQGWSGIAANFVAGPNFGTAGQLWTISIEFHIYIFVGALFFIWHQRIWWLLLPAIFFAEWPLQLLFGSYHGTGLGRGLFLVWLAGAGLLILRERIRPIGLAPALALVLVFGLGYGLAMPDGPYREYAFETYPFIIGAFVALLAGAKSVSRVPSVLAQAAHQLASYSFSLYLVHMTIIYAGVKLLSESGIDSPWAGAVICITAANAVALVISLLGERHYRRIGAALGSVVQRLRRVK